MSKSALYSALQPSSNSSQTRSESFHPEVKFVSEGFTKLKGNCNGEVFSLLGIKKRR